LSIEKESYQQQGVNQRGACDIGKEMKADGERDLGGDLSKGEGEFNLPVGKKVGGKTRRNGKSSKKKRATKTEG